jgi:ribosomal protein S6
MLRYETLFLTVPEITSDEAENLEKQLDKAVGEAKGTVLSYERWGKYRLAYPVRGYDYGIYYLMRFEVDNANKDALLSSLKNFFSVKFVDVVMRNKVIRINEKSSLDYKRPESLEETPSKDIDTFLKESKNLLQAGASSPAMEEEEHEQ